jgi:hypothetical protein
VDELLLESRRPRGRADRLGAPEAGRVHELHEGPVAQAEWVATVELLDERVDLRPCEASRAGGRRFRGASGTSGTRELPSVKRRNERTAASLRETLAGASFGRPRPSSDA